MNNNLLHYINLTNLTKRYHFHRFVIIEIFADSKNHAKNATLKFTWKQKLIQIKCFFEIGKYILMSSNGIRVTVNK